ncbi:hypothetical protein VU10_02980, partial [Desulfobulbus sp. US1]|nr:hypothetical protein [Desulfobulbus sp. US1]
MAARKKKSNSLKSIVTTLLIILVAGAFLIFKGNTPELLREYIPPALHTVFYPEQNSGSSTVAIKNLPVTEGNSTITSFSTSKTRLKKLYIKAGYFTTFYCGSSFDEDFTLDHSTSGFHFRTNES